MTVSGYNTIGPNFGFSSTPRGEVKNEILSTSH